MANCSNPACNAVLGTKPDGTPDGVTDATGTIAGTFCSQADLESLRGASVQITLSNG